MEHVRPDFIKFLEKRSPGVKPREVTLDELLYNPDEEIVKELGGGFMVSGDVIR